MPHGRCEAADSVDDPNKPSGCLFGDHQIVWVEAPPVLHGVKTAPYTYVGRFACPWHRRLYFIGLDMKRNRRAVEKHDARKEREKASRRASGEAPTLF